MVAISSAEVKYQLLTAATCEHILLKQLLKELDICKEQSVKLVCVNQTALQIASNPVFH